MNTRQKIQKSFAALLIIGLAASVGMYIYSTNKDSALSAEPPTFAFNKSQGDGWWGRENVNVQEVAKTSNYTGQTPIEKLPVADLTIFQGESMADKPEEGCFISYSYYDFPLSDVKSAYSNYFGGKHTDAGTLDTFEPIKSSIDTFEGTKEYDLHQYRFTLDGQDTLQGYQIGFIPLSSGYIRTEGICKTYEDLMLTEPILGSVELLDPKHP